MLNAPFRLVRRRRAPRRRGISLNLARPRDDKQIVEGAE